MRRWLFADQLGPHFLDDPDQPVLLVESTRVLARRRFHRQKAQLLLSALRHRARELGDRCDHRIGATYGEAVADYGEPLEVPDPTSWAARRFVTDLPGVTVVPTAYTATSRDDFSTWAHGGTDQGHSDGHGDGRWDGHGDGRWDGHGDGARGGTGGRRRLLMEDFYRWQRRRFGVLMDGDSPAGGRWNFDHDNRHPPPRRAHLDLPEPWSPSETEVDAEVREHLDRLERDGHAQFRGVDGPRRFAATRAEAGQALDWFVRHRLADFGPYEDAMLAGDWAMAHSTLSPALNLGLLHPLEVVAAAEQAYRRGEAPIASVEGFVRQVLGWREYVWGIYWWAGEDYVERNALGARTPLPRWFADLDADAVGAACLSDVLAGVRERGWVHHIPRLMVLGNWALQRGYDPRALTDFFHESFVDGYAWVMAPNVVGMSQYADGGLMATKPYAAGGAYIHRMSDYCGGCRYHPSHRLGEDACPFTAGYWAFLDRNAGALAANPRLRRPLAGLARLADRAAVTAAEHRRGAGPP
ncbi:cryptochrome/photolyase family protein [Frankia sp. AvcI1]|uniref:cryptochrome/photolyase family protein n=1 Tax=Frankia sp. AvcI1 TaxID=573496 RepID=UPI0006EC09EE|nr:cryptochrome/photolyase family protein [Frankia sp. AvcI1]